MSDVKFTVDKDNLEVRTSRVFKTSPERLWKACTTPEQIEQWWGPRSLTTIVDKMDFKVGGEWRFTHKAQDGSMEEFGFHGVYKEIVEGQKVTDTFEWEGAPGHGLTETLTLEDLGDGTTRMTTTAKYASLEDLEGMVSMGMEKGQTESMDRLGELVE